MAIIFSMTVISSALEGNKEFLSASSFLAFIVLSIGIVLPLKSC